MFIIHDRTVGLYSDFFRFGSPFCDFTCTVLYKLYNKYKQKKRFYAQYASAPEQGKPFGPARERSYEKNSATAFFLKYESEDLYIGGNGRHRFYGSCIAVFFFPL